MGLTRIGLAAGVARLSLALLGLVLAGCQSPTPTSPADPTEVSPTASQPAGTVEYSLMVTPSLQTAPAGSAVQFAAAVVPVPETERTSFRVDGLPGGWTAGFLGSAVPGRETLAVDTAGTAAPGRYRFRVTASFQTADPLSAEVALQVEPCVGFEPGEFTQAVDSNPVTVISAGKPSIEHGLLVPVQVCGDRPGGRLRVTLVEVESEAGSPMSEPPRFYLYQSRVWPAPAAIIAHGVPATLNVALPRSESAGWDLEAGVTPGLYLLVFERDSYGSSPDPAAVPARVTYRLESGPSLSLR